MQPAAQHTAAASRLQPASQPAGIGSTPQQKCKPTCTQFEKNVIIFVTTTPIDIKPNKGD